MFVQSYDIVVYILNISICKKNLAFQSPSFPPVMRPVGDEISTEYFQFHILLYIRQLQMIFTSQIVFEISLSQYNLQLA